jgi:hypothetical protein
MTQLVNLLARTVLRGAVYRYIWRLPKTVLIPVIALAIVAFLVVNHK